MVKNLPAIQETPGSIPGSRRSPTEGTGYPLKYSCLENSMCAHSVLMACSVVSDSLQPYVLQPARLLGQWDFPGKNTGVGCHFLHRGSSQPRDRTRISCGSCIARQVLYPEPPGKPLLLLHLTLNGIIRWWPAGGGSDTVAIVAGSQPQSWMPEFSSLLLNLCVMWVLYFLSLIIFQYHVSSPAFHSRNLQGHLRKTKL